MAKIADADEAYVETEMDEGSESFVEADSDSPPNEEFYQNEYVTMVLVYLSNPWVLLILAFLVYNLFRRIGVMERYRGWQEDRARSAEAAHIKKNPDLYRAKMEAMERARQRQQELHDVAAAKYAEEQRIREEEKRAQKLQDLEDLQAGKGYRNKSSSVSPDKAKPKKPTQNTLRGDFNPLMGGGGGGYRPARRGFSGGGGG